MLTIAKFLRYIWDVWIPHRDRPSPGVRFFADTANEKDNKIIDEGMEVYKGRITSEAREEYRRRVFRAATEKK